MFVQSAFGRSCNVREVYEWAGHNSVAFTLTQYGGLFEDGSTEAVDRLDALLAHAQEAGQAAGSAADRAPWMHPSGVPDSGVNHKW